MRRRIGVLAGAGGIAAVSALGWLALRPASTGNDGAAPSISGEASVVGSGASQVEAKNLGDRVVAHVPLEARPDGQRATVEDFAETVRLPGLASRAGEDAPERVVGLTPAELDKIRKRADAQRENDPERFQRHQEFKEERRRMRQARRRGAPIDKAQHRETHGQLQAPVRQRPAGGGTPMDAARAQ